MLHGGQRPDDPDYFDFSFSGLKTAVMELVRTLESDGSLDGERAHVAAAFQKAAVDVLVAKTLRAVAFTECPRVVLGGGVSANTLLRQEMSRRLSEARGASGDARVFHASPRLSLDNGAMVARAARFRFERGDVASLSASASATLPFPGLSSGFPAEPDQRT
jgi:N6-L-threonylcarbamoyladenine synthase